MSAFDISGHFAVQSACPLYPRKRTLEGASDMTALELVAIEKRTFQNSTGSIRISHDLEGSAIYAPNTPKPFSLQTRFYRHPRTSSCLRIGRQQLLPTSSFVRPAPSKGDNRSHGSRDLPPVQKLRANPAITLFARSAHMKRLDSLSTPFNINANRMRIISARPPKRNPNWRDVVLDTKVVYVCYDCCAGRRSATLATAVFQETGDSASNG